MPGNYASKKTSPQRGAAIRLLILTGILVGINILAARFHAAFDLTKEKRFTLSESTVRMLKSLDEVAIVDVYLEGKFPAGFQRLNEATREKLQSFKEVAGGNLLFRFVDPLEGKTNEERNQVSKQLHEKGVEPINLNVKGERNVSEQIIYPYALIKYKGETLPVRLLENHLGMSPLEVLNYSETLLEYKLGNAIHKLQSQRRPKLGYIMGHGEQLGILTVDLLTTLENFYSIDTIDLPSEYHINDALYQAIIINRPTLPFDEKDKLKIDQYVMRGGKILWAIDPLQSPVDSLQANGQFLTNDFDLNLDDMLFKYGVRLNHDLIEDAVQCNAIPLITGTLSNNQPQIELRPWPFLPFFIPKSPHPIVQNMDAVMGKFASSIDTIATPLNHKTILLESSQYSRSVPAPVRVSLSMLRFDPDPKLFKNPFRPTAVLVEGNFSSLFENRMAPMFLSVLRDSLRYPFKVATDIATCIIVLSDGDMLLNEFSNQQGVLELGYWQFTQKLFANKNFVLNCIEYLTDPNSLLEARSKNSKLRLLDADRVKEEKTMWQVVNILIPIALVLVFASAFIFFRKRRYEKPAA